MSVPGRGGIEVLTGEPHVGPWETLSKVSPLQMVPSGQSIPDSEGWFTQLTCLNCPSLASLFSLWVQLKSPPFPNLPSPNPCYTSASGVPCDLCYMERKIKFTASWVSLLRFKGTVGRHKLFLTITPPIVDILTCSQLFTPEVASGHHWPTEPPSTLRDNAIPLRGLKSPLFSLSFKRTQSSVWKPFCSLRKVI